MNNLIAYCDGSFGENGAASASLIFNDQDEFVGMIVKAHKVRTLYDAEMLGIIQILEYIERNNIAYKSLIIYTDSKAIVTRFPIVKRLERVPADFINEKKWLKILNLTRGKCFSMQYHRGHMQELNPNKVCDFLANLRRCTMAS